MPISVAPVAGRTASQLAGLQPARVDRAGQSVIDVDEEERKRKEEEERQRKIAEAQAKLAATKTKEEAQIVLGGYPDLADVLKMPELPSQIAEKLPTWQEKVATDLQTLQAKLPPGYEAVDPYADIRDIETGVPTLRITGEDQYLNGIKAMAERMGQTVDFPAQDISQMSPQERRIYRDSLREMYRSMIHLEHDYRMGYMPEGWGIEIREPDLEGELPPADIATMTPEQRQDYYKDLEKKYRWGWDYVEDEYGGERPEPTPNNYGYTYTTPSGWQLTENQVITPQGQELTDLQAKNFPGVAERLGGEFSEGDITELREFAEANPEEFVKSMQQRGNTPLTQATLKRMGLSNAEIEIIYPQAKQEKQSFLQTQLTVRRETEMASPEVAVMERRLKAVDFAGMSTTDKFKQILGVLSAIPLGAGIVGTELGRILTGITAEGKPIGEAILTPMEYEQFSKQYGVEIPGTGKWRIPFLTEEGRQGQPWVLGAAGMASFILDPTWLVSFGISKAGAKALPYVVKSLQYGIEKTAVKDALIAGELAGVKLAEKDAAKVVERAGTMIAKNSEASAKWADIIATKGFNAAEAKPLLKEIAESQVAKGAEVGTAKATEAVAPKAEEVISKITPEVTPKIPEVTPRVGGTVPPIKGEMATAQRQFNTQERAAVDNLVATSKKFDAIWDTTTAERQAQLKKKTARLTEAQESFQGAERIAEENKARAGLLTDIGLTEKEMLITPEDAKALENMIYASPEIGVWEKANTARAMRELVNDWRIPRPFEREYFEKVFGEDVAGMFKQSDKPRLGDYVTEVLYNSFISPKSNVVNFGGNAIASILAPVERLGAAIIEAPLAKVSGRARQRFVGEATQDLVGAWTGIPDGVRSWLEVMKSGQISGTALKAEMVRPRAFKGKLGRVINVNTDLMYAFDELFKSINRSAAMRAEAYRTASKEGFKGSKLLERLNVLINDPPEELVKSANKISEYRLFRAQSDLANRIIKIRDLEFLGKGIKPVQLVVPFVKTPVNLAKFGLERSPVGLLNLKIYMKLAQKNPEAADLLARTAMGSFVALAVTIYAKDGLITGAAPKTVGERDEFYRLGKQPYSLKIGNKWVSYQRLEPFNQMFLQASAIVDAFNNKEKNVIKLVEKFSKGIAQNATNQTFLTGVSDTLNALVEPERYGGGYFQRMIANLMPGASTARLAAQTIDTTIRAPQNVGEQVKANIPGLSQTVPAKVNIFGEPQKRETPAISPYAWSTEKDDKITKVMADAGVSPGFVGDSITDGKKKYKLNEQEHYDYQVLAGQILKKKMIAVIGNRKSVSTDTLDSAVRAARASAKTQELRILRKAGRKPDSE